MAFKPVIISIHSFGREHFKISLWFMILLVGEADTQLHAQRQTLFSVLAWIMCFRRKSRLGKLSIRRVRGRNCVQHLCPAQRAHLQWQWTVSLIVPLFTVWGHIVSGALDVPLVTVNSTQTDFLHTLGHKYSQDQTLWGKTYGLINLLSLFSSKRIHSKPQIPIS